MGGAVLANLGDMGRSTFKQAFSASFPERPKTANWIGMVIEPETELVLLVPDEDAYHTMSTHLHRIGCDDIVGYLCGGIAAWQEAGRPPPSAPVADIR